MYDKLWPCKCIFYSGSGRLRILVCTGVLSIMFMFYFLKLYEATQVRSMVTSFFHSKRNKHLSLSQFRDLMTKTRNMNSSLLFFQKKDLLCPIVPPKLVGPITINTDILSYRQIEDQNPAIKLGGLYTPTNCQARHHVAILVPYRDRQAHLKIFLQNIHPVLQRQEIDYGIYIIELVSGVKFNRAMLFNIGYVESTKLYNYTCFIFHDVDLVPENDLNLYTCSEDHPRHMSVAIDKMHYKLPYSQIFGGASSMTKEQFELVNGFSNLYFGWGGEDDDMYKRIVNQKMSIIRFSSAIARYKMLSHAKDSPNPVRRNLLRHGDQRFKTDGLNSLDYEVVKIVKRKLYTWVLVKIDDTVPIPEFVEDWKPWIWIVFVILLVWVIVFYIRSRQYIDYSYWIPVILNKCTDPFGCCN